MTFGIQFKMDKVQTKIAKDMTEL